MIDDLIAFIKENNVNVSFQPKRNYTKPELIQEYVRDLENALVYYSEKDLDHALALYRFQGKQNQLDNK